jgi:hypothetical protein
LFNVISGTSARFAIVVSPSTHYGLRPLHACLPFDLAAVSPASRLP